MKPYFVDEQSGITIYHADCRELLPQIWHHADVCVTDPPYGIGWVHGVGKGPYASKLSGIPCFGDDKPFDPSLILNSYHHVVLWGANHYADKLPVREGRWLVWDKHAGLGDRSMSDCEFAWARGSKGTAARMYRHLWDGFIRDSERSIPRVHPMQKPVPVMDWCFKFVPEGTVMDPYMGSGTTLEAAKKAGRRAIGIEIEERYCAIAAKRLSQGVLPLEAAQ